MAQIRITPEELREGASFLLQKMEAVIDEVNEIKSKVDAVASEWEGAAQKQFRSSFWINATNITKGFSRNNRRNFKSINCCSWYFRRSW